MAFQIKDFVSIAASMLNHMRGTTTKITDFMPGSVSRTLVEAPAVEIEELYQQIFNGLREAIPVATFQSFGFDKLPATYARGFVSVSCADPASEAFTLVSGSEFTTLDGRAYLSTKPILWAEGETSVRIPVIAAKPGLSYNVAAGAITESAALDAKYTVSNAAINNGRNDETDPERETRFAAFVAGLSRGTTYACIAAAESTTVTDEEGNIQEYVTRSGITEIAGYVRIFIYSSAGKPTAKLLANGQRLIDGHKDPETRKITSGYRSGGVRVDLLSMVEREVPLSARVRMQDGYTLTAAVIQSLEDEFATALTPVMGGDVLYVDDVRNALLNVIGVKDVLISTSENIICGPSEVLVPGLVSVTAL